VQQPGTRASKAAFVEVEVLEMGFEVDVQPFTSSGADFVGCGLDEPGADAVVLPARVDRGVEKECVAAAVPADLNEPYEFTSVEGADPGERVSLQPPSPRPDLGAVSAERSGVQRAELQVIDRKAAHELDRHSITLRSSSSTRGELVEVSHSRTTVQRRCGWRLRADLRRRAGGAAFPPEAEPDLTSISGREFVERWVAARHELEASFDPTR
jgi:hypothetical protein